MKSADRGDQCRIPIVPIVCTGELCFLASTSEYSKNIVMIFVIIFGRGL